MFSKRLSDLDVIEFCRSMRYSLSSGFMLRDALELLAKRGEPSLRPVASSLANELKAGWNLQESLERQSAYFPQLFLALAVVGEETGNLPEILGELERYYNMQCKLQRDFQSEIFWPVIQFFLAVIIVALMIFLMGVLQPQGSMAKPIDPLGMGLHGEKGAILFLLYVFGAVGLLFGLYKLIRATFGRRAIVEKMLFKIPMLGPCLMALAMTRFCTAFRLMLETDLSIRKTLNLSLMASDNQLFIQGVPSVEDALTRGNSVTDSLESAKCLPAKFLGVVAVAEECGRLPEAMRQQAEQFDEFARRRLVLINQFMSWLIWAGIAVFITYLIYTIFTNVYVGNLNRYLTE